jgi:hypothetical protein
MKAFLKSALLSMFALGVVVFAAPQAVEAKPPKMTVEKNTDRYGSDYRRIVMDKPQANVCRKTCQDDNNCKAYTFVKPGVQHPSKAICYLKHSKPPKTPNQCCESGEKQ